LQCGGERKVKERNGGPAPADETTAFRLLASMEEKVRKSKKKKKKARRAQRQREMDGRKEN
jgi:hypothetical protein